MHSMVQGTAPRVRHLGTPRTPCLANQQLLRKRLVCSCTYHTWCPFRGSQVWTLPGADLGPVSLGGAGEGAAGGGLLPGFVCRRFLMAKNDVNQVMWNHEAQKDKRILKPFRDDVSRGFSAQVQSRLGRGG